MIIQKNTKKEKTSFEPFPILWFGHWQTWKDFEGKI